MKTTTTKHIALALLFSVSVLFPLSSCGNGKKSEKQPDLAIDDNRGIDGLIGEDFVQILSQDPFYIPKSTRLEPNGKNKDKATFLYKGKSTDIPGLTLEYEVLSDSNDEIVSAKVSFSAKRMQDSKLYIMALRLSEKVSALPYKTADIPSLTSWFKKTMSNYNAFIEEVNVGDAIFKVYSMPELNNTIEISKRDDI